MIDPSDFAWFVALVPPGREKAARTIFRNIGLKTPTIYVPMRREFRHANKFTRTKRLKRAIEYPIAPGYCFIGHDRRYPPKWGLVFRFGIVRGTLGQDGIPAPLSADIVASMMDRESRHEFAAPEYQRWMETHHEWALGDMVTDGTLRGKVIEICGSMATIETQLFGTPRKATAPIKKLRAVE